VNRFIEIISSFQPKLVIGKKYKFNNLDLQPKKITLNISRCLKYIGCEIKPDFILNTLSNLGFKARLLEDENIVCLVPTYRNDVDTEYDLIEEVARCYGLDNIPYTPLSIQSQPISDINKKFEDKIRYFLQSKGLQEVINYSFISEKENASFLNKFLPVKVSNPISMDMAEMRSSLIPGLLKNLSHNINNYNDDLSLYEIGKSYHQFDDVIKEPMNLAVVLSGSRFDLNWSNTSEKFDFYDIKGIVESIIDGELKFEVISNSDNTIWHPTRCAQVFIKNGSNRDWDYIGVLGQVSPKVTKIFDLKKDVYACELYFEKIESLKSVSTTVTNIPKYPPSEKDIAVVVRKEIQAQSLIDTVKRCNSKNLQKVRVFDVYRGHEVGKDHISIALRLTWQSSTETLNDTYIKDQLNLILDKLKAEWGATLRD
jgi:phenylalanyl-tRNA synthetase beta chain